MEYDKNKTCCFIGHRKINETDGLRGELHSKIEALIINNAVCNFLFGSRSGFNDLCYEIVTELKEKYPHIIRVYVRAEYPHINDDYRAYLLEKYEYTYYPEHMVDAGRAAYVERNYEMIKNSEYCICYYDESYAPPRRRNSRRDQTYYQPKSGTEIAYKYAHKNCGQVINMFKLI